MRTDESDATDLEIRLVSDPEYFPRRSSTLSSSLSSPPRLCASAWFLPLHLRVSPARPLVPRRPAPGATSVLPNLVAPIAENIRRKGVPEGLVAFPGVA